MIFEAVTEPVSVQEKKSRKQWVDIGVKYLDAKKKTPGLTFKKFSDDAGLKYETASRAMRRYKEYIMEYYKLLNPDKSKSDWIDLGIKYLRGKAQGEYTSVKDFTDEFDLNYETAGRAFRKFRAEIMTKMDLEDAIQSKKKLTKAQQLKARQLEFKSKIRELEKIPKTAAEKKSADWFAQTVKKHVRSHKVTKPKIGKLYAFAYDAKHAATLPYWDKFPLIVYLGTNKYNHFVGLNLHYIPVKAREEFLLELLKFADTEGFTNRTTLNINWSKVKNMKAATFMIKSYIPNRVKGTFFEIKPVDWPNVVRLPLQKFVSGSQNKSYNANTVWKNAR